jgi:hypothetical protein
MTGLRFEKWEDNQRRLLRQEHIANPALSILSVIDPDSPLKDLSDDKGFQESRQLSYDDYTVGWIAVIDRESYTARLLLDRQHKSLPSAVGDPNSYIWEKWETTVLSLRTLPREHMVKVLLLTQS